MLRRNKGEGSITQLSNGKFRARLEIAPVNGKRQWLTATATTKKEVIAKLNQLKVTKSNQKTLQAFTDDIQTYVDTYLAAKEAEGIRLSSLGVLRYLLDNLAKHLELIPIQKVTKEHIQSYIRGLNVSQRTLKQKLNHIKCFFNWLKDEQNVIETNPVNSVKIRKTEAPRPHSDVLSTKEHECLKKLMEEQFFEFLVENHKDTLYYRMYPLYLLTYETGMREGEVAGLKWENVNFENDTITVSSKVIFIANVGVYEDVPKSYAGFRTIKISRATMKVLQELKEAYDEKGYTCNYVFYNIYRRKPYAPIALNRTFKQYLNAANITKNITFHSIRHTNASLMFGKVSPTVIAERLGHSNVQTTMRIYTHVLEDDKDRNEVVVTA